METLKKNILDIIITEINSINEKVKGLNFLEILKINLIAKILPIVNNLKFPLDQFDNLEKQINEENRNIKISIQYFTNSSIIRKKIIDKDTLFLFFNEAYKAPASFLALQALVINPLTCEPPVATAASTAFPPSHNILIPACAVS